ncbi:MAG TPA: metallophosphoesterase, partial [Paenibacillus sp.]|nr:metallophosphoesterase [Paenibacillus sp.]
HAVHFQNYKQMFAGISVTKDSLTYQAYDVDGKMLDEFVLTH